MRYVGGGAEVQQFTMKAKERETKKWAGGNTRHLCSQSVVNRYITYIRVYVAYIQYVYVTYSLCGPTTPISATF